MGDIYLRAVVVFCTDTSFQTNQHTSALLEAFLAEYEKREQSKVFSPREMVLCSKVLTNGEMTIVLAPSGSKIGWDTDKKWLKFREEFVRFAKTLPAASVLSIHDGYTYTDPRWRLVQE